MNFNEEDYLILYEDEDKDKNEIQKIKLKNYISICNNSMEELNTLLVNFVKDIKNQNINNEKEIINNTIKYIFNKVRDETLKNFNEISDKNI